MKKFIFFIFFINTTAFCQLNNFIKGIDLSFTPQIEDLGGSFYLEDTLSNPLEIFSQSGANYVRLRLWHSPADGYCGLQSTLDFAKKVKLAGFKLLLDIHYSDSWADPGKQYKPAAWQGLSFDDLKDSVYEYTKKVITDLKNQNTLPNMVQIGNEITGGMLWPDGKLYGVGNEAEQWVKFSELIKEGIRGVEDAADTSQVKIMIHIDRGGDNSGAIYFYDHLISQGVDFDIIGLSFYPWWHGTLDELSQNLNNLALKYNKDIIVAETAYPWTLNWDDDTGNIVGNSSQLLPGYPSSVEGQYSYLFDLIQIIKDVPDSKGIGLFYWAPDYISVQPIGSTWENLTLFDFEGNALNSINVFKESDTDTSNAVNVTFTLNTSTNFDTLLTSGFVQLRGEVVNGSDMLVSGEELTWDQSSEVILENFDGDYWKKTVRIIPGTEINYKYFTGHSPDEPTFLRFGWEGPIQPYDSSSGNFRTFIAGNKDTTLEVEYYNSTSNALNQYWKPFSSKNDSVAVYFRVNMQGVTSAGLFDPFENGPIGIRGENTAANVLSWDNSNIIMERETLSISNGSFWSGAAYFPKTKSGFTQEYKFYIENNQQIDFEENISNRSFIIPQKDSTIHWVYFNDNLTTDVNEIESSVSDFHLYQNYPNPFNPSTIIKYSIEKESFVQIKIYDILGNEINTLVNKNQLPGNYKVVFEADKNILNEKTLASGIYFFSLSATPISGQGFHQTKKMVLVR